MGEALPQSLLQVPRETRSVTRKSIFHQDWWLDAVAPSEWQEVTATRGDTIVGYLRYVERTRYGLSVCEMPKICRFLGPVVSVEAQKSEARSRAMHAIIKELLAPLAKHDHVKMVLDTGFTELSAFLASGYDVRVQPTLLLNCRQPLNVLWAGLRDKTRNLVRRAREDLCVREIADVGQFVRLYDANLEGEASYFDVASLYRLHAAASARGQCKILATVDRDGFVHAAAFFVWDDTRVHYFLSTRNRQMAHLGAMSLLMWSGMELAHKLARDFDFDGGMVEDTKYKFLIAFGGTPANRFEVERSSPLYQAQRSIRQTARSWMNQMAPSSGDRVSRFLKRGAVGVGKAVGVKLARGVGRLPGVSHALRIPIVHNSLKGTRAGKLLLPSIANLHPWDRPHPFDDEYGTDTSGVVECTAIDGLPSTVAAQAEPYAGSQPSIVRTALKSLEPLDTFTFVDLGCGKGRPLIIASELKFRDIVGVECSAQFAEIARRNAEIIRQRHPERTPIRVLVGDATEFVLPSGNVVVYLYNPFSEEQVVKVGRAVNAAIAADPTRVIYVVYYNPVAGRVFDASSALRRHYAATLPYADREIGFGPDIDDPVVIWCNSAEHIPAEAGREARIAIVDPGQRVQLIA